MPEQVETVTLQSLQEKTLKEMYGFAKHYKIPYYGQMNKKELALAIIRAQEEATGFFQVEGVLDSLDPSTTQVAKKIFTFLLLKSDALIFEMEI